MYKKKSNILCVTLLSSAMLSGCGGITAGNTVDNLTTVAQIGLAAKALYDISISFQSEEVANEKTVVKLYLQDNDSLPKQSKVVSYTSDIPSGNITSPGASTVIVSQLTVVPGEKSKKIAIEEKIEIFDNDDNTKVIQSLVQTVNKKSKGGNFTNRFTFTLPDGMPQGIYPIRTAAIVDNVEQQAINSKMQVALQVFPNNSYQFIALAE